MRFIAYAYFFVATGGALGAMARYGLNVWLQRNDILIAFSYLFATIVGGFACFYAGVVVTRTFLSGASA